MPEFMGRRRRPSLVPIRRLAVLTTALTAIGILLTQAGPVRPGPAPSAPPLVLGPSTVLPTPVTVPGVLADGGAYTPRLYLDRSTSVGVAPTRDGMAARLVLRTAKGFRQLRRVPASRQPQFPAFALAGGTVVWAETLTEADGVRTTLWRAPWRTPGAAVAITSQTGTFVGSGGQYDLVVHAGRVLWAALRSRAPAVTEIRSIGLDSRNPAVQSLSGRYVLSAWPWAVTARAVGSAVRLVDLDRGRTASVAVAPDQAGVCGPVWCRLDTAGADSLLRIDVQHPDGSGRRRLAGSEATPAIPDAALLDRYVPLTIDGATGASLTVYDADAARTILVATDVDSVQGNGALLWWSRGAGDELRWSVVDVRDLA